MYSLQALIECIRGVDFHIVASTPPRGTKYIDSSEFMRLHCRHQRCIKRVDDGVINVYCKLQRKHSSCNAANENGRRRVTAITKSQSRSKSTLTNTNMLDTVWMIREKTRK